MKRNKKVGILGGNFNPIHFGHLMVASQAAQRLKLERIFLMPEYLPPHVDEKTTIEAKDRLNMLQLALKNHPMLEIERIELERKGKSYSFDSISQLRRLHPENDYYFIIGNDMVDYLPTWHRIDELCKIVHFIGVKRTTSVKKESPYPVKWLDLPVMDISSSEIREMIRQGIEPDYLLPQEVQEYIKKNNLYKN